MKKLLVAPLVLVAQLALADEGMWTLDRFPSNIVRERYGFAPDDAWLERVRLASVRLDHCSASFVSPDGLVMTNHHCAHDCVQSLSRPGTDYVAAGYTATNRADELTCPGHSASQLLAVSDVTARIGKATHGLVGAGYDRALKAEKARIEKECGDGAKIRCDVVDLYRGGAYHLYRYRRYDDVRLVFAPELDAAFFGGDPDNFMFPRYDLDVAFLRAYEDGVPARTEHHFKWSPRALKGGELTFVPGHPGATSRLITVAQLVHRRDVGLPALLLRLAERRGFLAEFSRRGAEEARIAKEALFYTENSLKRYRGEHQALVDPAFFAGRVAAEEALRARIAADASLAKETGAAFEAIAQAQVELRGLWKRHVYLERGWAFDGELFRLARALVRAGDERAKKNDERLPEYADARIPALAHALLGATPIYHELEIAQLAWSLTKLREELGPDDPVVKKVLGTESPAQVAERAINGSTLADPAARQKLWDGGNKAIASSADAMIKLALVVDPDARAVRKRYEERVESVVQKNAELIAKARFAVYGTSTYPDATRTLRLSFGRVEGYEEDGRTVSPFTTFAGAFARATGSPPFALPETWLRAKGNLDLGGPLNFCTTNDIIGGNSGSPVIDRDARIVGVVFDGNIHSLGADLAYDGARNRAVAVDAHAILQALGKIYGAGSLVEELGRAR